MELSRPRAVLFDWDNTLVDTWPVIHQALYRTFTHMGHEPWTLQETRERVGKSMRDAFPALFGDRWQAAADKYRESYRAIHLERLRPLPQAEDALRMLKSAGVYTAVVSNKMGDTLRKEVEHLGWRDLFDSLVGSADATHDKPHPAPVYLALKDGRLEAGPDVWFLGDSEVDLEAAGVSGVTALLYGDLKLDADRPYHYRGFPFHSHYPDYPNFMALLRKTLVD